MEKVKNMLYAGLGIGTMVEKKLYDHYHELIKGGKESEPHFSSAIESFFDNIDMSKEDVRDKVSSLFEDIAEKLGYVKIDEYENLLKRVKNLEADLAKAQNQ